MQFEVPIKFTSGRVETEGVCSCVLIGQVACVVQVHQEGVAVPTEAILNVGIRIPGMV